MKGRKNSRRGKQWLLPLLLLSPPLLFAQHIDSATFKKNKLYYFGSLEAGFSNGALDLYQPPPSRHSGGPCFFATAGVSITHFLLEGRTFSYTILPFLTDPYPSLHCGSYDILAGRIFPVGSKHSFNVATGVSFLTFYYQAPSPNTYPITYPVGVVHVVSLPVEIKYNIVSLNILAGTIAYNINFNNTAVVSSVTFGFTLVKLRERISTEQK